MRFSLLLFFLVLFTASSQAVTGPAVWQNVISQDAELNALKATSTSLNNEAFLEMTPKRYRELTGKRLGVKGFFALKAAQKQLKKQTNVKSSASADIPQVVYVISLFFGLGWLMMGLMDDFTDNNWWVNLLLVILLVWIGGFIHGLIKMNEYY